MTASRARIADIAIGAVLLVLLACSREDPVYAGIWSTIRWLLPVAAVAYFARRIRNRAGETAHESRTTDLLWLLVAFGALVQFPFAFALYYAYIAPLFLAALLLTSLRILGSRSWLPWVLASFFGLFGVYAVHGAFLPATGFTYMARPPTRNLDLPRAGIPVTLEEHAVYSRVFRLVQEHARGAPILAYPDCPEVVFVTGSRSALKSAYRFMAPDEVSADGLQKLLQRGNIGVAVLNKSPSFSDNISDIEYAVVRSHFSHHEDVGQFRVLWNEPGSQQP